MQRIPASPLWRALRQASADRLPPVALALAMLLSAALILWVNRGTTFLFDELRFFAASADLDLRAVLEPDNGHLIATTRVLYKLVLEGFGASYLAFRILGVLTVALAAGVFYALVRRRIGAVVALAPTVILLFLGSAWMHVAAPLGFSSIFSLTAGLGALIALERDDLPGDAAASGLLVLSVATFTTGLAFLVGVAAAVLIRPDRRRRAWLFLVPLVLYAIWWFWALQFDSADEEVQLSNLLTAPVWFLDSLAVAAGALLGINYDFADPSPFALDLAWGRVAGAVMLVALAWRLRSGEIPRAVWVSLAILFAYWGMGALAAGVAGRAPDALRYIYPGVVGVLLVATAAFQGARITRAAAIGLAAAVVVSLAGNLAAMRDGGGYFRDIYTPGIRAELAMLELAAESVPAEFAPSAALPREGLRRHPNVRAGEYLEAVREFGSPAFTIAEVVSQAEEVRAGADRVLALATGLNLEPGTASGACRRVTAGEDGTVAVELPAGEISLAVDGRGPVDVTVGRFADSGSVPLGQLLPGESARVVIPADAAAQPWRAAIPADSVDVCERRPAD